MERWLTGCSGRGVALGRHGDDGGSGVASVKEGVVLKHFERDDGEFVCYPRQSNQTITSTVEVAFPFPGDDEIRWASSYNHAFLEERRASSKLDDKWVTRKLNLFLG
jgi:hypothetical protein